MVTNSQAVFYFLSGGSWLLANIKVYLIELQNMEKGAVSLLIPKSVARGLRAGMAPLGTGGH